MFKSKIQTIMLVVLVIASIWCGTKLQILITTLSSDNVQLVIEDLKSENEFLYSQIKTITSNSEPFSFEKVKVRDMEYSIKIVIAKEGIYDNDPDDRGGETVYGLARNKIPNNPIWKKLDSLKKTLAKRQKCKIEKLSNSIISAAIKKDNDFLKIATAYYEKIWKRLDLDKIKYWPFADFIFDSAINNGEGYTIPMWRKALNSINYKNRLGSDITEIDLDNVFKSIPSLVKMTNVAYDKNQCRKLIRLMKILRSGRYIELAANRHKNRKYLNGWLSRSI